LTNNIKKILIVRLSSIGDIILSTPLVRSLKEKFPDSKIDYLIKAEYIDLIKNNPHLNEIITYESSKGFKGLKNIKKLIKKKRI